MADRIDTVEARNRLKPRTPPYWHRIATGQHLGFRKMSARSEGTWLAQAYDKVARKQTRQTLGSFDHLPSHQRFDAASAAAQAWFKHLGAGGTTEVVTVREACEAYVADLRENGREATAKDAAARFGRWVYGHAIAGAKLSDLRPSHVEAWRKALSKAAVVVTPHTDKSNTRPRSPSSINRDMTALRAVFNFAHERRYVTNDLAWLTALKPIERADGRRDAYIDRGQRLAMINNSASDVAAFLRALALVPLRPGALAALTVASFDKRLGVLTVGKDKAGKDRKIKLPPTTVAMFEGFAKDKLPSAPLLSRADGRPWNKDAWKKPVKDAAKATGLSDEVTAYAMRHSAITDLVTGGLDLLTVAQLSGTSVAMIERHYGHLRAEHAAAALAKLAL